MTFNIGFKLMDLDDLLERSTNPNPRSMSNRKRLLSSLYSLSLGEYWFEFDGQIVPQIHPAWLKAYPDQGVVTGIDYLVLQLFHDIEEFFPVMLSPLPQELSEVIDTGHWNAWLDVLEMNGGGRKLDLFEEPIKGYAQLARYWWQGRKFQFWYLVEPPSIYIWSPDLENVRISWDTSEKRIDGVLSMVETKGSLVITRAEFLAASNAFKDRLLSELTNLVSELERREFIETDGKANLLRQVKLYRDQFDAALNAGVGDDWPETLAAIRRLEPLIGPLL